MTSSTIPDDMQAVAAPSAGGPEALTLERRETPRPGSHELLIRVHAAGVNRPDVMQRQGNYPPPQGVTDILGLEVAGDIVAMGDQVGRHQIGARVMALLPGGGYAEYAIVDESNAVPIARGLSMTQAAAIPETFFTVWTNVFDRAGLSAGQRLLVHGGTSGIGTTAIQLARAFGADVIATAGSTDKCNYCLDIGASLAINYRQEDFVTRIQDYTYGTGVDVILDMVGNYYVGRNLDIAAVGAYILQIAYLGGFETIFDMRKLLGKRAHLLGCALRGQSIEAKADIANALENRVKPLWERGCCQPVIDSTFDLEDVTAAHQRMDEPHVGKVVLSVNSVVGSGVAP